MKKSNSSRSVSRRWKERVTLARKQQKKAGDKKLFLFRGRVQGGSWVVFVVVGKGEVVGVCNMARALVTFLLRSVCLLDAFPRRFFPFCFASVSYESSTSSSTFASSPPLGCISIAALVLVRHTHVHSSMSPFLVVCISGDCMRSKSHTCWTTSVCCVLSGEDTRREGVGEEEGGSWVSVSFCLWCLDSLVERRAASTCERKVDNSDGRAGALPPQKFTTPPPPHAWREDLRRPLGKRGGGGVVPISLLSTPVATYKCIPRCRRIGRCLRPYLCVYGSIFVYLYSDPRPVGVSVCVECGVFEEEKEGEEWEDWESKFSFSLAFFPPV